MSFEHPMMLIGTSAALIPIIIHLINRHRAKIRAFAAIDFLLLSDQRLARRLLLKQWLVLCLRILLLAAIPLALAKPFVEPERVTEANPSLPAAVAIVVDDSMSLESKREDGTSWREAAIEAARTRIKAGGPRTSYAVIAAGQPARVLTPGLTFNHQLAEQALSKITGRNRSGDLPSALREAERILAQSEQQERRIVVFSDHAEHAWRGLTEPWAMARPPIVELVDMNRPRVLPNLAITQVTTSSTPVSGSDRVRVDVTVESFDATDQQTTIEVALGGQKKSETLRLNANTSAHKSFTLSLTPGLRRAQGTVRISEDALSADNEWFFTVDLGSTAHVTVVNGSPSEVPFRDELFFVRAALGSSVSGAHRIRAYYQTVANWNPVNLEQMDVVVLANVSELTSQQRIFLEDFVKRGGGLLITAGDQLTPQSNSSYGELLPLPIRGIKQIANRNAPSSALNALRIQNADLNHPALIDFSKLDDASLFKARFFSYALLDASLSRETEILASFGGGIPALTEKSLGQGRILFFGATIDLDWSDLAIRTSFLPFVQQLVLYLGSKLKREHTNNYTLGETIERSVPMGTGALILERPDGVKRSMGTPDKPLDESLTIIDADMVGHYRLARADNPSDATFFAVNANRAESDFRGVDRTKLELTLKKPGKGSNLAPQAKAEWKDNTDHASTERTKVWPAILFGLFFLLISEAWLVLRG